MWAPTRPVVPGGTMRSNTLSTRGAACETTAASRRKGRVRMLKASSSEMQDACSQDHRAKQGGTPDRHPAIHRLIENQVPDDHADVGCLGKHVVENAHHIAGPFRAQEALD